MAKPITPHAGRPDSNPGSLHSLWMFITAISGIDDQAERARLTATGLPSLLSCHVSGVALIDDGKAPSHLIIQKNGHEVSSDHTEKLLADLESLYQEALRYSKLLILTSQDGTENQGIPPSILEIGIKNLVIAPLRTLRRQYGLVLVGREHHENFSRNEELIISTFSEHFAIGLENLHLYQSLHQHSQTLEEQVEDRTKKLRQAEERHRALLEINNAIIANLDRDSLLQAIAETLHKVLQFERVTLTLLDPATDVLKVHALATTSTAKRFLTVGMEFPRQGSPLAPVYESKQPLIRHHLEQGPLIGIEHNLVKEGIRSIVAVPLMAKGEPFGTLNLGSREPEAYSPEDAELLMEVGQQVALAVENMMVYEEIAQLKARLEQENLYLQDEIKIVTGYADIVGQSPALRSMLRQIELVAPTDASVLILGESGTGKELVAREIHKRSQRQNRPLIRVNCASIPKELYESEFFGHVKGAFTGALKDRAGRFEVADGGTLFLDEVGEIPLELQNKLLRVLQEQQYERVGDERTRQVDVRIIAATNRDLRKEVETGRFRQDLYYRLNVYPIEVSPLGQRKEDIPLLAAHLLEIAAKKLNCAKPRLTQGHVMTLQNYDWPGNVRELQNVIERAVITSRGDALHFDLPGTGSAQKKTLPESPIVTEEGSELALIPEREKQRRERENLLTALQRSNWKVGGRGGAAELLGVKPTTLHSRIKKMGIKRSG